MRKAIVGAITGNLPSNVVGTTPTSIASGLNDDLGIVAVVAAAGETSLNAQGKVTVRRLRTRMGIVANVIDPVTGVNKTVGTANTLEYNFGVSDEALAKAYMLEAITLTKERWTAMTQAQIEEFVDSCYALGGDFANETVQDAVEAKFKALWGY